MFLPQFVVRIYHDIRSFSSLCGGWAGAHTQNHRNRGASGLANLARSMGDHVKAVVEPSANYWIKVYDRLEDECVVVKLSTPSRTKAIAEARIKMDKLDAKTLATLLRGSLVAESYVPTRKNRERRLAMNCTKPAFQFAV
jgi:hypothetical protein